MGLFDRKKKLKGAEPCCLCGNPDVTDKLADGWICQECIRKGAGFRSRGEKMEDISKERVIKCTEENMKNRELYKQFTPTLKIKEYLYIDEEKRQWLIPPTAMEKGVIPTVFSYDDFIDISVQKNGVDVISGGGAETLAGGALFGTAGALVGASIGRKTVGEEIKHLNIFIRTRKPRFNLTGILLYNNDRGAKAGTTTYNYLLLDVEQILSAFAVIKADSEEKKQFKQNVSPLSVPDEIVKYKKLCDDGIITPEEFEAKKKELLGL